MKQNLSFSILSVLAALSFSSPVFGTTPVRKQLSSAPSTAEQTKEISQAIARAKARAQKNSAKPGDFVDAKGKPVSAPVAQASAPSKTKRLGTVVRPMNGNLKSINTNPTATAANTVSTAIDDTPGIGPITSGDVKFPIAITNLATFGRKEELETIGDKEYRLRNELSVGAIHKTGWGLGATARYTQQNYDDKSRNKNSRDDMSLVFNHPDLIHTDTFSAGGKVRIFLPTSQGSHDSSFLQYRYYATQGLELAHKFSLSQLIMPIWMSQNSPGATDSPFFVYECLELAHQTTKTLALAIGEQTQVETHYGSPTGTTIEVYPFLDFTITKNILIEPKFYFPVYVNGLIDDSPSGVTMNQTQAELTVKFSI